MGIPQLIYIVITVLSIGINMAQHGKPKTGRENFGTVLLSQIIIYALLIWGGFFK